MLCASRAPINCHVFFEGARREIHTIWGCCEIVIVVDVLVVAVVVVAVRPQLPHQLPRLPTGAKRNGRAHDGPLESMEG